MLYIIGRIVTFEICNMSQLIVEIDSEEVTKNHQMIVIVLQIRPRAISTLPLGLGMKKRPQLLTLPKPLPQQGEILSKFSVRSALNV